MKSREALVVEARAKVTWGESSESVFAYLQSQGLGDKEALPLLEMLLAERAAQIRADGFKKLMLGLGLIAIPCVAYFKFYLTGVISLRPFSATIVLGLWGVWKVIDGFWRISGARKMRGEISNLN